MEAGRKPRIRIMGDHGMEDVDYDSIPEPTQAMELADYFKPVKISAKALDIGSKIIPQSYQIQHGGLHSYLSKFANEVFSKLPASETVGKCGSVNFFFEFDSDGPVLRSVSL